MLEKHSAADWTLALLEHRGDCLWLLLVGYISHAIQRLPWLCQPQLNSQCMHAFLAEGASGGRGKASSNKRPGQELSRAAGVSQAAGQAGGSAPAPGAAGYAYDEVPVQPVPLKYVVTEVRRRLVPVGYMGWFEGAACMHMLQGKTFSGPSCFAAHAASRIPVAWEFDRLPSLRHLSRCSSGGKAMV